MGIRLENEKYIVIFDSWIFSLEKKALPKKLSISVGKKMQDEIIDTIRGFEKSLIP